MQVHVVVHVAIGTASAKFVGIPRQFRKGGITGTLHVKVKPVILVNDDTGSP